MLFFSDFFLITLIKKIKKVEIHSIFDLSYKKTGEKCCVWRGTGSILMRGIIPLTGQLLYICHYKSSNDLRCH